MAHILGRPVLGKTKAGIQPCITINKKDIDWRAILKSAQRARSEVMQEKEEVLLVKKQAVHTAAAVVDEILTPSPIKDS